MLKPALEFYATIHAKLVNENNTKVSLYAKTIELQIAELLETVNINEGLFYGLSNFEQYADEYLMSDYLTALNLVKFNLKSLGYDVSINFTNCLLIKF
jgi:hypothetical protein